MSASSGVGDARVGDVVVRPSQRVAVRRAVRAKNRPAVSAHTLWLALCVVMAIAVGTLVWFNPVGVPVSMFAPVAVLSGLTLRPRAHVSLCAVIVIFLAWRVRSTPFDNAYLMLAIAALCVVMTMMWMLSSSRNRLGLVGFGGEDMLVDLRDRLSRNAVVPALPDGWSVDTTLRSANGEGFSGDFLVAGHGADDRSLELALVDVSGKGAGAGTRSLLLSGAYSGLLGALEPAQFLGAANNFLVRQAWREGFATAVHVSIDLSTGDYLVANAGHPPVAHYSGGSGRWRLLDDRPGPLLGVVSGIDFPHLTGRLLPGDALVMYTDGVVESRAVPLTDGIDRLLGAVTGALIDGKGRVAERAASVALSGESDDRAVVVIQRT